MNALIRAAADDSRSSVWMKVAFVGVITAALTIGGSISAQTESPPDDARSKVEHANDDWGPESNGLRCRLVAVPSSMDDESPEMVQTTEQFAQDDEVTFAVELTNVSDKRLTLLGVRYGESYPTDQR